jgi:hypothetical protein
MRVPLPDDQAHALLADKRNKAKPVAKKILSYLHASAAFMLANGDVIYYQERYFLLDFQSFFAFITARERVFTTAHSHAYFLVHHPRHLAEFYQYFRGPFDGSVASLTHLDRACRRLVRGGIGEADLFLPLVCYAAEVFMRYSEGQWSADPKSLEAAAIIGRDGKVYDPYFCIRKILVTTHRPNALESVLLFQVALRWSGKPVQNRVLSFDCHERQPPTCQTSALRCSFPNRGPAPSE